MAAKFFVIGLLLICSSLAEKHYTKINPHEVKYSFGTGKSVHNYQTENQ